jgi:hypothetical protein
MNKYMILGETHQKIIIIPAKLTKITGYDWWVTGYNWYQL